MTEQVDVLVVGKVQGFLIKGYIPKHLTVHICTDYEEAYSEYLIHMNPHKKHVVILDSREDEELVGKVFSDV